MASASSSREAYAVSNVSSHMANAAAGAHSLMGQAVASLSRDPSVSARDKTSTPSALSTSRSQVPARRRDYDICLVFPFKASEETTEDGKPKINRDLKEKMMKHERESVLKNLQNCGLHVHCFYSRDRDEIFVKVGAGAQKLRDTAARMKYRLQLKPEYLSGYAEYRNDFPGRPENHFADRRMVNHIYKTFSLDDYPAEDALFSTRDKISIVHHIVTAKDRDCAGINVGTLLHNGELSAYFPLHEDTLLKEIAADKLSWLWMGAAHAMTVRDYFGEKVTIYFLFLAFYWKSLIIPAGVGLIFQPIRWFTSTPDNITAVPFCIFVATWSVLMPHFWKRQENKFSIQWGTLDMVPEMEACRPQFWGEQRINPVTNQVEPSYPWGRRAAKYIFSLTVIAMTGVILMACMLFVLILRHMSQTWMPENLRSHRIVIFQFGLAIMVEMTNGILTEVAKLLTNWENHRTATEYDKHQLIKVMLFKFVNNYFVLYYMAFFKKELNLFGMQCLHGDCLLDVELQLAAFVVVRLTLSNAMEFAFPRVLAFCRGFSEKRKAYIHNMSSYSKLEMADMSSAEQQAKKEPYESFSEFDETLIAHGYASLFAVTAPWVCTATLIWVMVESVLDVKGLAESHRRPIPVKIPNNEPWDSAFEIYGYIAAATNITLLVFTSSQYSGNSTPQRVFLWIYLVHVVLFFKVLVIAILPERPRSIETMRLKQEAMAHRCLENIKLEPEQDFTMTRHQRTVNPTIHEQDHHDLDAEETEPHLNLSASGKGLCSGVFESMPVCVVLLFAACTAVAVLTAVLLRLFPSLGGD